MKLIDKQTNQENFLRNSERVSVVLTAHNPRLKFMIQGIKKRRVAHFACLL